MVEIFTYLGGTNVPPRDDSRRLSVPFTDGTVAVSFLGWSAFDDVSKTLSVPFVDMMIT